MGIKKEDTVVVLTGKEQGKRGRVIAIFPKKGRLLVERVNMIKKHMKPNQQYKQGGIIEMEASLESSNVMLVCPKCDTPTRVGNQMLEDGRKIRACKKCKEVMD
ncbi:MAG: 50S ribosomal protein L24 [Thermodesulfovibrionales bacterium]|nr:50S ribosomal protein L24 [Thermodesulfovibrionales bacterium]